ncbi:MAG TPA: aldo/keto reductase family protein [Candidatus Nanopelagicales bacterium]|nr:aldo/keto reductase family protein [Candidatus Nanopelagicales bacterium]
MEFRHLGRSGLKISALTYGNWITHGSQVDDATAHATIHAALDAGITTFDTADVYAGTRAEEVMGSALRGVRREGLEIFTKVYWPTGPGVNDRGLSRKHIMESCNNSLRRLQTDYVDLYQAHRFDYETPLEETLRAFDDLVRQGKVLYVGVSEWKAEQIREAMAIAQDMGFDRIISNQPQYSMLYRVIESDVVPTCEEMGVSQIVWSPMAQGVLTGKYLPGAQVPAGSRASGGEGAQMIERWMREDVLQAVQRLVPIAQDMGLTMSQLAIAWVLTNTNVAAAIIGASRPEQIDENVKAAGVTLPDDVMSAIDYALGDLVVTDPALTESPNPRP